MAWAHSIVNRDAWLQSAERLHSGACSLLGLWGDPGCAHMALMETTTRECSVLDIANCAITRRDSDEPSAETIAKRVAGSRVAV